MAPAVLCHRIILKPESRLRKVTARSVIEEVLDSAVVPTSGARVMA
jgi:MoxR-like ATPase